MIKEKVLMRWYNFYTEQTTGHTRLAFEFSQNGAYTVVVSFNNEPPSELFLCQICNDYVTSSFLDLESHMRLKHYSLPQKDIDTALSLLK